MSLGLKKFLLIYASQTGQAEAIAQEVKDSSEKHGFIADFHCMSKAYKEYTLENEKYAVFIVSTTGDGEPPETARKFWRRINKRTLPSDSFSQLNYCLLALGDSNYSTFCNFGKQLDKRLHQLGATQFIDSGYGDDAVGLEIVVEPWLESLWPALEELFKQKRATSEMENTGLDLLIFRQEKDDLSIEDNNINENGEKLLETTERMAVLTDNEKLSAYDAGGHVRDKNSEILNSDQYLVSNLDNLRLNDGEIAATPTTELNKQELINNSKKLDELYSSRLSNDISQKKCYLLSSSPPLSGSVLTLPNLTPPFLEISFLPQQAGKNSNNHIRIFSASTMSDTSFIPIKNATRLTTDDAVKTVLEIDLNITDTAIDFHPGDHVYISCPNYEQEVNWLSKRLRLIEEMDMCMKLEVTGAKNKRLAEYFSNLPSCLTLRSFLTHYCDLRAVPKKAFLRLLAAHTDDPVEKRRLEELCSRQGAEDYTNVIRNPCRSVMDLLKAFPSCHPPIVRLIEQFPKLQARPYSIASSFLAEPSTLRIVFTVVEISRDDEYDQRGLCTGWLDTITKKIQQRTQPLDTLSSVQIPIYVRQSLNFHLPHDPLVPIIMIAAGTGIAPFMGFIQHRSEEKKKFEAVFGDMWLFFGCRHANKDFLYRHEIQRFVDQGVLSHFFVTFSRGASDDNNKNRYVQDAIAKNGNTLTKVIVEKMATIYVCGDAKNMAKDVQATIVKLLIDEMWMSKEEAEEYVKQMQKDRRYLQDIWT